MCGPEPWNYQAELRAALAAKGWARDSVAFLMAEAFLAERIEDGESLAAVLQSIPHCTVPLPEW